MQTATRLLASVALAAGFALSSPAQAVEYALFDLGTLTVGQRMWATGLNDQGQVIGHSYGDRLDDGISASNQYQAFTTGIDGRGLRSLGTLGGSWSTAYDINNAGQIVGSSQTADGSTRGYVTTGGAMTEVGTFNGRGVSTLSRINDRGQVVGLAWNRYESPRLSYDADYLGFMADTPTGPMRALTGPAGQPLQGLGLNA